MPYMHPDAIEYRRKRWMRPDAYRFAKPGSPEAETGFLHPWAEVARRKQMAADEAKAREAAEQAEFERQVKALRASQARLRIMLADLMFELVLRALGRKYSPDQLRLPAGNPDGGQWTDGGGGSDASGETTPTQLTQLIRICMAGSSSITTDRWGNSSYWVDYDCADGYSFRQYGPGNKIPAFARDPRR